MVKIESMADKPEDSAIAMEIDEIRRRIAYLINTDEISVTDRIAIAKKALEIIEKSETDKEAVQ